ncbi:uncharacterized protein LOC121482477 [Vulpes lagopus]|uniref:uncharacterized protein LOC121482477 n=1 Tax=Vulpes lagopus TaxID=494514 RepID=UPI001BCA1482|nr:uncharacterized protein LOC121482477 [Vulpes lagopus]
MSVSTELLGEISSSKRKQQRSVEGNCLSYEPLFLNFSPALAEALAQIPRTADSRSSTSSPSLCQLGVRAAEGGTVTPRQFITSRSADCCGARLCQRNLPIPPSEPGVGLGKSHFFVQLGKGCTVSAGAPALQQSRNFFTMLRAALHSQSNQALTLVKAQVRLRVTEDELLYPAMLETETTLEVLNHRPRIQANIIQSTACVLYIYELILSTTIRVGGIIILI